MHEPASVFEDDKTGECMLEADELLKMYIGIINIYVQRTGKPVWQIAVDIKRDIFMSAEEAQAYGIVDMVADADFL